MPLGNPSVRSLSRDAENNLKGLGLDKAILVGQGMGLPVALELYRHSPERVLSIIGLCGSERGPLSAVAPFSMGHLLSRSFEKILLPLGVPFWKLYRAFWRSYVPLRDGGLEEGEKVVPFPKGGAMTWQERLYRTDPRIGLRVLLSMLFYKPSRFLPQMSVPVLIMGGRQDRLVPPRRYRRMARKIPGSSLVLLEGCTHQALRDNPDAVNRNVKAFLQEVGLW